MVFRKSLLTVVMSAALIPAVYAVDEDKKSDSAPVSARPNSLERVESLVNTPLDCMLDVVYNSLHSKNPIAADDYFARYPMIKHVRAVISLVGMYYVVTNEKAQQTVVSVASQAVSLTKRALGVEKKGICTKSWDKVCGACTKTCDAGK